MLYFISNGKGQIKFGHTISPDGRLKTIQTSNPENCRFILTLDIQNAEQVEALMKERFAYCQLKGEWFEVPFSVALDGLIEIRSLMHFPGQAELGLASPPLPTLAECAEEFKKWWIEKHNPDWDETLPLDQLWKTYQMDFLRRKADEPSFEEKARAAGEIFAKIQASLKSVHPESD